MLLDFQEEREMCSRGNQKKKKVLPGKESMGFGYDEDTGIQKC